MTTKEFAETHGFEFVNGRITGKLEFMQDIDGEATMFACGRGNFRLESGHEKAQAIRLLKGIPIK